MIATYDESGRADQRYGNSGPGAKLNIVSFVGVISGFVLILNRLFWRWKKGTPGIDDLIIVLAWLALVCLVVITFIAVDYGYGRNAATLTRTEASDVLRMFYLYQIFYKLSLNLSKLSILTLYLRVFDTKDWFGHIAKFLIFIVSTYTISIILANIFICHPISTYWSTSPPLPTSPDTPAGTCINILAYWYASALYNILSETFMLLSVLARIWTLPSHSHPPILQFRQKINLTIVLGLGVFTVITAILRMTTLNQTAMATDRTGGTLTSTIWSSVEAGLGLAVANLPMLRQLLRWKGWCGAGWFRSSAEKSRSRSRSRSLAQQQLHQGRTGSGYTLAIQGGFPSKPRGHSHGRNLSSPGNVPLRRASLSLSLSNSHTTYTHTDVSSDLSPRTPDLHGHFDPERHPTTPISPLSYDAFHSHSDTHPHVNFQTQSGSPVSRTNSDVFRATILDTTKNANTKTDTHPHDAPTTISPHHTSDSNPFHRNSDASTPTPSVTSTCTAPSTLRSPTEPASMVRISNAPGPGLRGLRLSSGGGLG